jgi:hypothetical protein
MQRYRCRTEAQRHKGTDMEGQHRAQVLLQMCRDSDVQRCRDAEMQRCRCRCRGAEVQRCRGAQMVRCRYAGAVMQRFKVQRYR